MRTLTELKKDLPKEKDIFRLQLFVDLDEDYAELMYIDRNHTGREYLEVCYENVDMKKINRLKSSLIRKYGNKIMMEDIDFAN